jgi:transcriptional regulator
MFVPTAFAEVDRGEVLHLLRHIGFGHLVTVDDGGRPQSTSIPFVVDDAATVLRAHLARANPHWRSLDGVEALLIVGGVDGYVSPRWYPSKQDGGRVVPTWNYELVHVRGRVRVLDGVDDRRSVVESLTDVNERALDGPDSAIWSVDDAPADFIDTQLRAIVAVELEIAEVTAKRKLSQNRPEPDRHGVVAGLAAADDPRSQALVERMRPLTDGSAQHP